jgi:hypothetical protein
MRASATGAFLAASTFATDAARYKKMACRPLQVVDKEGKNGVFLLCSKQEKINALIFLIFIDLHPSCLRQNGGLSAAANKWPAGHFRLKRTNAQVCPLCRYQPTINALIILTYYSGVTGQNPSTRRLSAVSEGLPAFFALSGRFTQRSGKLRHPLSPYIERAGRNSDSGRYRPPSYPPAP